VDDPEHYDYALESAGGMGGPKRVRYHKFVKGFSTVAYTAKGVYRPK